MHFKQSEFGRIWTLGRHRSLTLQVTIDKEGELEESWGALKDRVIEWRKKRGECGRDVAVWYEVRHELVPAAKALLGRHLLCNEERVFAGVKLQVFVVGPNHSFYCEIGMPTLD